jgi:hypothetical protein
MEVNIMPDLIQLLDVVALTEDLPAENLYRGQVGTVVEILAPDAFEVEFINNQGQTYALLALKTSQLLGLHYEPTLAA